MSEEKQRGHRPVWKIKAKGYPVYIDIWENGWDTRDKYGTKLAFTAYRAKPIMEDPPRYIKKHAMSLEETWALYKLLKEAIPEMVKRNWSYGHPIPEDMPFVSDDEKDENRRRLEDPREFSREPLKPEAPTLKFIPIDEL